MYKLCFILQLCISLAFSAGAQSKNTEFSQQDYVQQYKDDAIKEMIRTGVPASITLAQGILESASGNSRLALKANNHFGIKCHDWNGPKIYKDDDKKSECFRKYKTAYDSYVDHSDFLRNRTRYAFLFELKPTDYKAWAKGLKNAGYATNPKYPQLLVKIIEDHKLYQYDQKDIKQPQLIVQEVKHIAPPQQSTTEETKTSANSIHKQLENNNIRYTTAKKGDTYFSIANQLNMGLWQIYKYNEIEKDKKIPTEGEIIYLQPKRNKSAVDSHTVKQGDTLRSIAQTYGIKMKELSLKNNLPLQPDQPLEAGTTLSLNK